MNSILRIKELIDRIRNELSLTDTTIDDEIWNKTKDSFLCARINLSIKMEHFGKAIGIYDD